MSDPCAQFVEYAEAHQAKWIANLAEAVEIPSVSGDASFRAEVYKMGAWLKNKLAEVGFRESELSPYSQEASA